VKEHESGMEAGGGEERPVLGGGRGRTDGRTDGRTGTAEERRRLIPVAAAVVAAGRDPSPSLPPSRIAFFARSGHKD